MDHCAVAPSWAQHQNSHEERRKHKQMGRMHAYQSEARKEKEKEMSCMVIRPQYPSCSVRLKRKSGVTSLRAAPLQIRADDIKKGLSVTTSASLLHQQFHTQLITNTLRVRARTNKRRFPVTVHCSLERPLQVRQVILPRLLGQRSSIFAIVPRPDS